MGITKKYLEELGLTKEQSEAIFAERGKEIETEKAGKESLEKQIAEKEKAIEELNETIKGFDGTNKTLEELQKELESAKGKVAEYEQNETKRIELEKQTKAEEELINRFNTVAGEKAWKHEDIKNGRLNAFKQALADEVNKGKGDSEIFEAVTKDMDCFANPQQKNEMPGGNAGTDTEKTQFKNFF